ncbi:MAG: sulfatase [Pirellulaceae bacterium]
MTSNRPNIVLLIAHDLGRHLGPYGWAASQSPALLRLAAESARFDAHFVSSPGCSQSRSSLVTGRYPHSNGQFGLAHLGWTLHRDEQLLPALLRTAGYRTALVGIWHLHDWTLAAFDDVAEDVSTRDSSPEGAAEVASSRAADWIRHRRPGDRPFYLHVGFWETHRPFCGNDGERGAADQIAIDRADTPPYLPDNAPTRREIAELHQSVARVDEGVARVLAAIDEAGIRDNTLVLFTADHGLPFPRAKGTLYDPGIAVALLCRWPGRIAAGSTVDSLTSNVDVAPTLLQAAGVEVPARMQGASFLTSMTAAARHDRCDAIFAEKTYHEHYDPMRCVRTERFKYIRNFAERPRLVLASDIYNSPTRQSMTDDESLWSHRPEEELYDLQADADEFINLADRGEHAAELAALRARLLDWMKTTDDPLLHGPIPRPTPP